MDYVVVLLTVFAPTHRSLTTTLGLCRIEDQSAGYKLMLRSGCVSLVENGGGPP